ncbi:hypothetical protein ABZY58_05170 [Micromonospora tulbaghiae]|uniref:hypothetical protein n=1 Tax=Micromonospora tulbaghiae TaxID=479978 RepID=UPI0033B44C39
MNIAQAFGHRQHLSPTGSFNMPQLRLRALINHFDSRTASTTSAVGLVSRAEGEGMLRALLTTYLRDIGMDVTPTGYRPCTTVNGKRAVLDDLLLLVCPDGRRKLLSVEYKFWTASSYQARAVPTDVPVEAYAWHGWHDGESSWQGAVTRESFLSWEPGAKVLGLLDRSQLPTAYRELPVRPVLAVWTPLLARPCGSGVCWSEAWLADEWHRGQGYDEPLAVFSGSLFARSTNRVSVPTELDQATFGATIRAATQIVNDLVEEE